LTVFHRRHQAASKFSVYVSHATPAASRQLSRAIAVVMPLPDRHIRWILREIDCRIFMINCDAGATLALFAFIHTLPCYADAAAHCLIRTTAYLIVLMLG
jgi:hypothetical protein